MFLFVSIIFAKNLDVFKVLENPETLMPDKDGRHSDIMT